MIFLDFFKRGTFELWARGVPKIEIKKPGYKVKYPCLFETGIAHEEEHVKSFKQPCSDFKNCVDKQSSKPLWGLFGGEPTISHKDFVECSKKHNGGKVKDCFTEEKRAYEVSIKKAKDLIKDKKCSKEKTNLEENIRYSESIKDEAPNCK